MNAGWTEEGVMGTRTWLSGMLSATLLWVAFAVGAGQEEVYAYPETRAVVELVDAAAKAVETRGEDAFPDFRVEGSPWFQGDLYVFIWDLEGNRFVYPPDPENERQNVLHLEDAGGKPIGRMFVQMAREGGGWVHYQWNRPHDLEPIWKSTYIVGVTAPSGIRYLVGSGAYAGQMEQAFLVQEVEAAAALLEREGRAAFDRLRDRKDRFFFHDTYVFVTSATGVELVNPAFPAIEGRNLWDAKDMEGKYLVRDYVTGALEQGSIWTSYLWPRPGMPERPVRKTTYARKVVVDGEPLIVGAGIYAENEFAGRYFLTSDGVRLHYLEAGSGPSMVFVPGWTMPAWIWEPQLKYFAATHRVVALDPRGQGRSEKPSEGYHSARRGRDVCELLEHLGSEPAVVVGWSLGMQESLECAHDFGTKRIRALVLVDHPVFLDPTLTLAIADERVKSLQLNREPWTRRFIEEMFRSPRSEAYLAALTQAALGTPTNAAAIMMANLHFVGPTDLSAAVDALDRPALFIYSSLDWAVAAAKEVREAWPKALVNVIEGASHALFVDKPQEFNSVLEEFVASLPG
jgi:pimeloyl-ACP methyl ester carboxylesterase